MAHEGFASNAWLLKGITGSVAGWLDLERDALRFVTPEEIVFEVPLTSVTGIAFPWYYFGGGMKLKAAGIPYRLSFVKPNGAEYAQARLLATVASPLALLSVADKVSDIGEGVDVGKRWRTLLGVRAMAKSSSRV